MKLDERCDDNDDSSVQMTSLIAPNHFETVIEEHKSISCRPRID